MEERAASAGKRGISRRERGKEGERERESEKGKKAGREIYSSTLFGPDVQ